MNNTADLIAPLTAIERFQETNATLELFLLKNKIKAAARKPITHHFDRMLAGEVEPFAPDQLPGHLHDDFLRMVRQELYLKKNTGKEFIVKPGKSYLP